MAGAAPLKVMTALSPVTAFHSVSGACSDPRFNNATTAYTAVSPIQNSLSRFVSLSLLSVGSGRTLVSFISSSFFKFSSILLTFFLSLSFFMDIADLNLFLTMMSVHTYAKYAKVATFIKEPTPVMIS